MTFFTICINSWNPWAGIFSGLCWGWGMGSRIQNYNDIRTSDSLTHWCFCFLMFASVFCLCRWIFSGSPSHDWRWTPHSSWVSCSSFVLQFYFFFLFVFSSPTPAAYEGSQARGLIGATAASLPHSHSNAKSKPHLQPTPHLTATPDP